MQCEGGVGVELVGLSASGVFVNELREGGVAASCDLLQLGDQILQVNEEPVGTYYIQWNTVNSN